MNTTKKVQISTEYERKLDRAAPPYLRGKRRTTQQIRWVIDEYLKLRRKSGSSKPESN